MKDILKRFFIVVHYLMFILGCGCLYEYLIQDGDGVSLFFSIFFFLLGSSLRYIFGGKFLIFPWSKEKVDK